MKVIIAGSRRLTIPGIVPYAAAQFPFGEITEVVSGTARGIDKAGEEWAAYWCLPVTRFPAEWDKYGKSAGYKRNIEMAEYADALLAIWDGSSRGTMHMINIMETCNKPRYVLTIAGDAYEAD